MKLKKRKIDFHPVYIIVEGKKIDNLYPRRKEKAKEVNLNGL